MEPEVLEKMGALGHPAGCDPPHGEDLSGGQLCEEREESPLCCQAMKRRVRSAEELEAPHFCVWIIYLYHSEKGSLSL